MILGFFTYVGQKRKFDETSDKTLAVLIALHASTATSKEMLLACIDEQLRTASVKLKTLEDREYEFEVFSEESGLQMRGKTELTSQTINFVGETGYAVISETDGLSFKALTSNGSYYDMRCNFVTLAAQMNNVNDHQVEGERQTTNQCASNITDSMKERWVSKLDYTLTGINHRGLEVALSEIITKPSLIYFGYTFCPDVCPLDVARNDQAVSLLKLEGNDVQQVFISVDPKRDTPSVLSAFVDNFDKSTIGVTGTEKQIKDLSRAFSTYYKKVGSDSDDYYLVDHSTQTYLILPDHGFVNYFNRNSSAEEVASSASCHIKSLQ